MSNPSLSGRPLRRNGKPQSCEACRKSKVRCDHNRPTCDRCRLRNIDAECVYHPAPLTRPRRHASWIGHEPASPSHAATGSATVTPVVPVAPGAACLSSIGLDTRSGGETIDAGGAGDVDDEECNPNVDQLQDVPVEYNAYNHLLQPVQSVQPVQQNFLGSTSYSSVFAHSWKDGAAGSNSQWPAPLGNETDNVPGSVKLDPDRVHDGALLLERFMDIPHLDDLIQRFYRVRDFVFIPAKLIFRSVESIRVTIQERSQSDGHLQKLAADIFVNTLRQLDCSHPINAKEIHTLFTGPRLRWEIIGIVFTIVALALKSFLETESLFGNEGEPIDPLKFVAQMAKASHLCLSFCDENEHSSDLLAWYQYESLLLQTALHGDSSNLAWKRLGDLATTIYALGMHHNIDSKTGASFFFKESRNKCFAASYTLDKAIATLLGRPPRLLSSYFSSSLPLDLTDEEAMADDGELILSTAKLDVNGWNTDGRIRSSSWIRVRTLVSFVREEVLQLSLGTATSGILEIEDRASNISDRSKQMWDSVPTLLKYNDSCWQVRKCPKECYMLLIVYIDYVYNEFLLHRVVARHTKRESILLYDSAWRLLSLSLTLCQMRDRLWEFKHKISWTVVYTGLPSAGILAVELLRLTQHSHASCLTIPRAELIRSLSVFIDSMGWVSQQGHGNHSLCLVAQKVLTQILDAILDPVTFGQTEGDTNLRNADSFSDEFMRMETYMSSSRATEWSTWIVD
ncbi:hypothetical protein F5884DRAFT_807811 [Xylogone sp. PMI_703]|nr:hypothetical protein F5884DRAFT_807811 [Xylogone sp. PMI_703]